LAVRGLALRAEEKLPEAKAALESALTALPAGDAEWRATATKALQDVSDPAARYMHQAAELQQKGKFAEAAAALEKAGGLLPAEAERLRAQRALVLLEAAKAGAKNGKPAAGDSSLAAARKEADAAAAAGVALGFYAAGRVAEEEGRYVDAAASYRKALAAHPKADAEGSRYRLALARALAALPAEPAKVGRADVVAPWNIAVTVATLLLPPPSAAAADEAQRLADEVLASPDSTPEQRAQALAVKGQWTPALVKYVEALRPSLTREQADGLLELISKHPGLKASLQSKTPEPMEAARRYGAGVRALDAGRFADAEREFQEAVENDGQDARFYYFLGLARLYQKKADAFAAFVEGARLEAEGHPSRAAVNAALERVQGEPRKEINRARNQPRE
jgi:hypothetical protein